jgi:hypothetical protein
MQTASDASIPLERCPGCGADLPKLDGPTHRYIGASPACWSIFTSLFNAGEPPLAVSPLNALIGDAYAAQHPGLPSAQAIQSVAVHLLTLYGAFMRGVAPDKALWIRQRALRKKKNSKQAPFWWLTPPALAGSLTVADIVQAPTPPMRAEKAREYVEQVWHLWSQPHLQTLSSWYDEFVVKE